MNLILHPQHGDSNLSSYYHRAFTNAVELYIVTAYLTDWDDSLVLNSGCRSFRLIIGKDFGITRKAACTKVMKWLSPNRKSNFLVAEQIGGFHPKAVFWKEVNGDSFGIIGSSNLTLAAFKTNYEANVYGALSQQEYATGKQWVANIGKQSVVVSEDWLANYKEAPAGNGRSTFGKKQANHIAAPLIPFKLPRPLGTTKLIALRREQLLAYKKKRAGLIRLFRRCADKEITSLEFFNKLPDYWSWDIGDRLQGFGYEILGKNSNFKELSDSFLRILDAKDDERDDVVTEEIDRLKKQRVSTRGSFLSEMLCLRFPDEYPILNQPVKKFLSAIKFRAPRKASEGACYIDLAKKLRLSLVQNPTHPAKNLAELDTVIWKNYGKTVSEKYGKTVSAD